MPICALDVGGKSPDLEPGCSGKSPNLPVSMSSSVILKMGVTTAVLTSQGCGGDQMS